VLGRSRPAATARGRQRPPVHAGQKAVAARYSGLAGPAGAARVARSGGGHRAPGADGGVVPDGSPEDGTLRGLRLGHLRRPVDPPDKVIWAGAYPRCGAA
jgi:hypothetical protein